MMWQQKYYQANDQLVRIQSQKGMNQGDSYLQISSHENNLIR